jgi:hypothetical protein
VGPRFLGNFYCDHCSHGMREPIWLLDSGSRLCATHYQAIVGAPPPSAELLDVAELPPAGPPWSRVVPGLRARPSEAVQHGLELQGVRNIQLEHGTQTVGDTPAWTVPDEALVELVLMASAHRDDAAPNKALVRMALLRILHGTERP